MLQAGGFPLELPGAIAVQIAVKPTTMLRMLAMDVEELLRMPIGAVAMSVTGLTPGLVLRQGRSAPACLHLHASRADAARQRQGAGAGFGLGHVEMGRTPRGQINKAQVAVEGGIARSHGLRGNGSTMTGIAGGDGPDAPSASSIQPWIQTITRWLPDAARRIVSMVWEDLTRNETTLSRASFENAITVIAATLDQRHHSPRHAMYADAGEHCADRMDDFDAFASRKSADDVTPSSDTYQMEDFTTPAACSA
jgi:dihydroxy-acid dehydratase